MQSVNFVFLMLRKYSFFVINVILPFCGRTEKLLLAEVLEIRGEYP